MEIKPIIKVVAMLVVMLAATGKLPYLVNKIRAAQLYLLKDSQASEWKSALVPR